ncbi:MAG: hypothetical protein P8X90_08055 [Desulfobacterales bacterium]
MVRLFQNPGHETALGPSIVASLQLYVAKDFGARPDLSLHGHLEQMRRLGGHLVMIDVGADLGARRGRGGWQRTKYLPRPGFEELRFIGPPDL